MRAFKIIFGVFLILVVAPLQLSYGLLEDTVIVSNETLTEALSSKTTTEFDDATSKTLVDYIKRRISRGGIIGIIDILLSVLIGISGLLLIILQGYYLFTSVFFIITACIWILSLIYSFFWGSIVTGGPYNPLTVIPFSLAIALLYISVKGLKNKIGK